MITKAPGGTRKGWGEATVSDLVSCLQYGYTASADSALRGPRFLRITDIKNGRIDWPSVPGCDIPLEKLPKYRLQDGDIVFARTGSIEKAARVHFPPEAVFASYLIRGRPLRPELSHWLAMFVRSLGYLAQARAASVGIGRSNLNARRIGGFRLPLPPLPEQARIRAAVDVLFTRLDDAEATLERVKRNLERYRASVLQAAVEGRLVTTESELARRAGRTGPKASSLLGLLEKGPHSVGVPEGWCWATVGQVQESMKNGLYKSAEHYASEGTACLRMYNIERGEIVWKNIKRMRLTREEIEEYRLLPGDLLVNRVNSRELVGKAAAFPDGIEECVFESKNIRLRARTGVAHPRYLSYTFEVYGREYFNRNAQQVVGMASISQPQVAGLRFQLPPMPEQLRIVQTVDSCLTVGRKVAGEIDDTVRRLQTLRQSVFQMAFNGRLVDQDPTDEPASFLLERIRAERAKALSSRTPRRRGRSRKAVKK